MEYSFASYLLPQALQAKRPLRLRIKFACPAADKWVGMDVDDSVLRYGTIYLSDKGKALAARFEYKRGEGSVKTHPDPFLDPIQDVLQKHFGLDPTTLKLEDFQVVELIQTSDSHGHNPRYTEGERLAISWTTPWQFQGQSDEILSTLCDGNRSKMQTVLTLLMSKIGWFSPIGKFVRADRYSRPALQLKTAGKPITPKHVFLKSGAIFDYHTYKVVAPSLDAWIREYLDLPAEQEIAWSVYMDTIMISKVSLRAVLTETQITKDHIETMARRIYWKQVDPKIKAAMPILQATIQKYDSYKTGITHLLAIRKEDMHLEQYMIGFEGVHRTYDEKPLTKNPTEEERAAANQWRGWLSSEAVKDLASRPGYQWYAQIRTRWCTCQYEPIDLLSCL